MSNNDHAPFSPSGFERISECLGSVWLCKDLPEVSNPAADKGTELHKFGKAALEAGLRYNKSTSDVLDDIENEFEQWMVSGYVNFCINLYSQITVLSDKNPKFYIEHRVKLTEHVWGTADFLIWFTAGGKDYLIVVDFKSGIAKTDNKQLPVYAACAAHTLGIKPAVYYLYTYQPKVYGEEPNRIKMTSDEMEEFLKFIQRTEKKALKILENGAKPADFKPGPYCYYCKAKLHRKCTAFYGKVHEDAMLELDDLSENLPVIPKNDLAKLIKAYKMRDLVDSWFADLEHHLMNLTMAGKAEGELKLVESRSQRRWKKDVDKVAEGLKKIGIKDPWQKKLITIGTADRLAKDKDFSKLVEMTTPKLQLAFMDDPRPGVDVHGESTDLLDDETKGKKSGDKKDAKGTKRKGPRKVRASAGRPRPGAKAKAKKSNSKRHSSKSK